MVSVRIPSAREDHVDIGVTERGGGAGNVDKTASQEPIRVQSQEETKTDASEKSLTNKYVPA